MERVMTAPKMFMAGVWAVITMVALYKGMVGTSGMSWWFWPTLLLPLIAFVWWMLDRALLERRIKRLEARSEIGDERRVVARGDLTNLEHRLYEIDTRIAQLEASGIAVGDPEDSHSGRGAIAVFSAKGK